MEVKVKHLLLVKDLWGLIDGSEVLRDDASAQQRADFTKRTQKAFSTIVMSISSSQLYLITLCEDPARAWVTLRNHFEHDTLVNKLLLKKKYFRMKMRESTSMEVHIKTMKELTDRLAAINAPIAELLRCWEACHLVIPPWLQHLKLEIISHLAVRNKGCNEIIFSMEVQMLEVEQDKH